MSATEGGLTENPRTFGPRAQEIVERCRRLEGGGLRTFADDAPLVWHRADRYWIEDPDGQTYLDLYGGFAVANIGHNHPRVVEAIRDQAGQLMHCPSAHASMVRAEFLEALASIAPRGLTRILPAITGAMANELALAIARTIRGGEVVTFTGSYFGRSAGVVGLAGKARYREALGVAPAGVFVPYPYPFRMGDAATDLVMQALDDVVHRPNGPHPLAAVILEPIQGNGGVVIPPVGFLERIRAFCDETGALMILDEIQSGAGRTGCMWAIEHTRVLPDLMTVGKGIGGGLAVAAVLGREERMRWQPDTYTTTFLTNNLNLAAATAAISVLRDENLPLRSAQLGQMALRYLRGHLGSAGAVGEIRGKGLWIGIELVDAEGRPDAALAAHVQRLARQRGVLVGRGGHDENVVKISPPLIIEADDLLHGLNTLAACIAEAGEGRRHHAAAQLYRRTMG